MILVDTSSLIDYFKGINSLSCQHLETLMDKNIPFGICNYTYQELLQGAKTEKEFRQMKEYLDDLTFYDLLYGKKSYENAASMYFKCRKAGITIRSTIDMLIAEIAMENHLYLLHNDSDFVNMAKIISELKLI